MVTVVVVDRLSSIGHAGLQTRIVQRWGSVASPVSFIPEQLTVQLLYGRMSGYEVAVGVLWGPDSFLFRPGNHCQRRRKHLLRLTDSHPPDQFQCRSRMEDNVTQEWRGTPLNIM